MAGRDEAWLGRHGMEGKRFGSLAWLGEASLTSSGRDRKGLALQKNRGFVCVQSPRGSEQSRELEGEKFATEIRTEFQSLQTEQSTLLERQQAAILSEGAEQAALAVRRCAYSDGELAEIRTLLQRSSATNYLSSAVARIQISGPESELNAALDIGTIGAGGGVLILWQMPDVSETGARRAQAPRLEIAGAVVQRPILQRLVWPRYLGCARNPDRFGARTVMPNEPLLTGGVSPDQKVEKAAAPDAVVPTFTHPSSFAPQAARPNAMHSARKKVAQVSDIEAAQCAWIWPMPSGQAMSDRDR